MFIFFERKRVLARAHTHAHKHTQIDAMELVHANSVDAKKHARISRWLEPHRHAKHYSSLVGRIWLFFATYHAR